MEDNFENLFQVGEYKEEYNTILNKNVNFKEIYQSNGLINHIQRRHSNCITYIDKISEIINNPDYIGTNPNEREESIELIKKFDKNILIGIKVDFDKGYLYVSTLHDVHQSKIDRRLNSGRLIRYKK